jgi:hypothetical protein
LTLVGPGNGADLLKEPEFLLVGVPLAGKHGGKFGLPLFFLKQPKNVADPIV